MLGDVRLALGFVPFQLHRVNVGQKMLVCKHRSAIGNLNAAV
jgi:hypothetical protein